MQKDEQLLKIISNETIKSISNLDVVTPAVFSSYFSKYALSHNFKIDEVATDKYLDDKITVFENIQNQTSKNVQILSESAKKAVDAIKERDEKTLNKVLEETNTLKKQMQKLKESLYKDELTSVYNRKWLHDNCLKEHDKSFKSDGVLALLDLNYFKLVNDNYGHIIGDKVLIFIANQFKKTDGFVIRYGGDEFIILFEKAESVADVSDTLHKLREDILKKHLKAKNNLFRVSFSFGLQIYKKGNELSEIVELADERMYHDKIEIKNRIKGISI